MRSTGEFLGTGGEMETKKSRFYFLFSDVAFATLTFPAALILIYTKKMPTTGPMMGLRRRLIVRRRMKKGRGRMIGGR